MYSGHAGLLRNGQLLEANPPKSSGKALNEVFLEISLKPWHLEESDSNNERGDKLALVRRGGEKK